MSSRSPSRPELRRRGWAALAALALAPLLAPAPAAAAVPLPVAGVLSGGGQTALVVDLSASSGTGKRAVEVTLDGQKQRAQIVPVMSDGLAVSIVVDAAQTGASSLPAWLSAAARFILEAPPSTRSVVIPDRRPASAVTDPLSGPSGVVTALTSIRAGGDRDTAAVLTLARQQFPAAATGRRLVVVYTSARDAGGIEADTLAADFRATGTMLVVVGTAEAGAYWAAAAAATGGFFAPIGDPAVAPALDQVETTLGDRYLVLFPTPTKLPARVAVRVDTGDLTMTTETTVAAPGSDRSALPTVLVGSAVAATAVALVVAIAVLLIRRPRPETGPPGLTEVFIGRAGVPSAARGRAVVPQRIDPRRPIGPPRSLDPPPALDPPRPPHPLDPPHPLSPPRPADPPRSLGPPWS